MRILRRFKDMFSGAEPTGPWAVQFSIICWPITHAVLPTDLQRHLARLLFERKQEILSESELRLNEPLKTISGWGPAEITERADWLAAVAIECWVPPVPGVVTPYAGFDWSRVDRAVDAVPIGRWTSYGDLAELVGTAAQSTASHVATTVGLSYAYRVLSGDGSISLNFHWTNPDDNRDPVEVLTGEGIEFDASGRASQAQRLTPDELADIVGGDEDEV